MMKQYREARESLEADTLLLFRLGDFYEMFENDAERGAALLGITLTKRHDMPMAGIPSHAAEGYLTKLLNLGHKVAICDQLEPPKTGKLVKRGITRILTPGTLLEDQQLDASSNHFLVALDLDKKAAFASWLDLSTGKFNLTQSSNLQDFLSVLSYFLPVKFFCLKACLPRLLIGRKAIFLRMNWSGFSRTLPKPNARISISIRRRVPGRSWKVWES